MVKNKSIYIVIFFLFIGCVSSATIPSFNNIIGSYRSLIKPNNDISFNIHFSSNIQDDLIIPYNQNQAELISGHNGYKISQTLLLQDMINQYLVLKFPNQNAENVIEININLLDFWLEEYSLNIFGKERSALSEYFHTQHSDELEYDLTANLIFNVNIIYNGEIINRIIQVSSDTKYKKVFNKDSNNYYNREAIQVVHGRNINLLNNRALRELNLIFERVIGI